jgi:hypothetical protein
MLLVYALLTKYQCYRAYHLKRNPTTTYYGTKTKSETGTPRANRLPQHPLVLESRSSMLLGRCSRQLRDSCAGANMVHKQNVCSFSNVTSQSDRLPLLKKHFEMCILTSSHPVRQYMDWYVTFRATGTVCGRKYRAMLTSETLRSITKH